MNKENKKAAQERRAEERAKEEKKAKIKRALPWIIVVAIFICLVAYFIHDAWAPKDNAVDETVVESTETSSEETADDNEEDEDAETAEDETYDTTAGTVVKTGDTVRIDYEGKIDGVAFSGGTGSYDLLLGSGSFIDGFEEQVAGHAVGDTFDITTTFPEDYDNSDLAGQEAVFTVTINGIVTRNDVDYTQGTVAEDGQTVYIIYSGAIDGEKFSGGTGSTDLTLGSGTFIDGFEEQVVGHSVGETFDITTTFPEDYWSSDMAGKEAVFTVTIIGIVK